METSPAGFSAEKFKINYVLECLKTNTDGAEEIIDCTCGLDPRYTLLTLELQAGNTDTLFLGAENEINIIFIVFDDFRIPKLAR